MAEGDVEDHIGTGRSTDIGGDVAGGRETDLGGSHSGGDGQDARVTGDGQTVRTGEHPVSREEAEKADPPQAGIPDDVRYGTRKTVGMDEDDGAGNPDTSGVPGSTTGGG